MFQVVCTNPIQIIIYLDYNNLLVVHYIKSLVQSPAIVPDQMKKKSKLYVRVVLRIKSFNKRGRVTGSVIMFVDSTTISIDIEADYDSNTQSIKNTTKFYHFH